MMSYLYKLVVKAIVIYCFIPSAIFAAESPFSVGFFRFNATDYYNPYFYGEAGLRGEVSYATGEVNNHLLRLQLYAYPGDDNIFEPVAEYGYNRKLSFWGFDLVARPVAGVGFVKLQYPAPYYPAVTHQYLPWLRVGYDALIGHGITEDLSFAVGDRGRVLYYLGETYGTFAGDRTAWQNAPFGAFEFAVKTNWKLIRRSGVEIGGYYDDVFLNPGKKLRPFAEAGVGWFF
jgi:hypothetical protein